MREKNIFNERKKNLEYTFRKSTCTPANLLLDVNQVNQRQIISCWTFMSNKNYMNIEAVESLIKRKIKLVWRFFFYSNIQDQKKKEWYLENTEGKEKWFENYP